MSQVNAVSKLKAEMDQHKNNAYVQVVGAYLLEHVAKYPADAGKIAAEGKTILKSLDEMRKAAEKKKVGNCAVLAPQEGFGIVMKYYGIEKSDGLPMTEPVPAAQPPVRAKPARQEIDFDVSLEDFL